MTASRRLRLRAGVFVGLVVIPLVTLAVLLVAPNPVAERGPAVVDLCDSSTLCEDGVEVVTARNVELSAPDLLDRPTLLPLGLTVALLAGVLVGPLVPSGFRRCLDGTERSPSLDPVRCRVRRRGPPALRAS